MFEKIIISILPSSGWFNSSEDGHLMKFHWLKSSNATRTFTNYSFSPTKSDGIEKQKCSAKLTIRFLGAVINELKLRLWSQFELFLVE